MVRIEASTYSQEDVLGQVASVHCHVEGQLLDYVADAYAPSDVTGCCEGVWVVNLEQV